MLSECSAFYRAKVVKESGRLLGSGVDSQVAVPGPEALPVDARVLLSVLLEGFIQILGPVDTVKDVGILESIKKLVS